MDSSFIYETFQSIYKGIIQIFKETYACYKENIDFLVLSTIIAISFFPNSSKVSPYWYAISHGIRFVVGIYVCVTLFMRQLFDKIGYEGFDYFDILRWIFIPFTINVESPYIVSNYLFEETEFQAIEKILRSYIYNLAALQCGSIFKNKFKNKASSLTELSFYIVLCLIVSIYIVYSIVQRNFFPIFMMTPIFLSLVLIILDRALFFRRVKKIYIDKHKMIINLIRDVLFSIECKKTPYSIYINTNSIFTITTILFLTTISYKVSIL